MNIPNSSYLNLSSHSLLFTFHYQGAQHEFLGVATARAGCSLTQTSIETDLTSFLPQQRSIEYVATPVLIASSTTISYWWPGSDLSGMSQSRPGNKISQSRQSSFPSHSYQAQLSSLPVTKIMSPVQTKIPSCSSFSTWHLLSRLTKTTFGPQRVISFYKQSSSCLAVQEQSQLIPL